MFRISSPHPHFASLSDPSPHSRRREQQGFCPVRPIASLLLLALFLVGCGGQMADQPRYEPYEQSALSPDGSASRHLVEGTVPRGYMQDDTLLYTGQSGEGDEAEAATVYPFPITREVLEHGQERYNISCTPCHGRLGEGNGMIVRRGYPQPPTFHQERLREAPPGHFFNVISNGWGAMPSYDHIPVVDRWAIAAYIQVLQSSQNATIEQVPVDQRDSLDEEPQTEPESNEHGGEEP